MKKILILVILLTLVTSVAYASVSDKIDERQRIISDLDAITEETITQAIDERFKFFLEPRDETDFYNITWETILPADED